MKSKLNSQANSFDTNLPRSWLTVEFTWNGDAYGDGDGLGALHKAPGPGEVACPDTLVGVHLERVVVATAEDAVDPSEEHVAVVAAPDSREGEDGKSAHEDGSLAEVLAGNATLHRVAHHQQSEGGATQSPCQTQVRLQQHCCVAQTFLLHLVGLSTIFLWLTIFAINLRNCKVSHFFLPEHCWWDRQRFRSFISSQIIA